VKKIQTFFLDLKLEAQVYFLGWHDWNIWNYKFKPNSRKKLCLLFQENRILQDDLVWSSTQKAAASPRRQNFDRLERTHDLRWDFTLKVFTWFQVGFYSKVLRDFRLDFIWNVSWKILEESGILLCIFGCYRFYWFFSKTNEHTNIVINISILKVSLLLIFFLNIKISVIERT